MRTKTSTFLVTLFFAAAAIIARAATPAPPIPDTPAGQVLSAWLAAFNSGDRQTMSQFILTHAPSKMSKLDQQMELRQMSGGFYLRQIAGSTPTTVAALLQERGSDSFVRLTLDVDAAAPHYLKNLGLQLTDRPAEFAIAHLTQTQLVSSLTQTLQNQAAAGAFSGAVLVAKNGVPVFRHAYGSADREHNVPNTLDTRFRIGSMNKMFTAVAIMQLVQAGKIDLDKPLGTYLPDYPNKSVASSVTIRQLLTHTGGTGDIFGPEFDKNRLQLRTVADYVKVYGNRPLLFKPGSRWDYSNYGFILLGAVVEQVSGQSYFDYVRQHVFEPAGMTATGSEPEDAPVPNRSIGYMASPGGKLVPNTDTLPYRGTPAGGGYSTVGDLLRFANALEQHKLLDAKYTEMMMTGKVLTPGHGSYGFGFGDQVINGTRCFGHNGGAPGMNGDLEICPSAGYVVAVLANLDPPAAGRISEFITNRLPQR